MIHLIWNFQLYRTMKLAKHDTRRNRKDIEHINILKCQRFIATTKWFLKYKADTDGFTGQ